MISHYVENSAESGTVTGYSRMNTNRLYNYDAPGSLGDASYMQCNNKSSTSQIFDPDPSSGIPPGGSGLYLLNDLPEDRKGFSVLIICFHSA